jgi:preprotein translocase subunit SecF
MNLPVPDNYKKYMIIPIIILVLSLLFLGYKLGTTGLDLSIDLRGGTEISIELTSAIPVSQIQSELSQYNLNIRSIESFTGQTIILEMENSDQVEDIINTVEQTHTIKGWSQQTVGPALGESFFAQSQIALLLAFVAMAIAVFIIFRIFMPSIYVVFAGFADIVETLALSQLLGIELSLATFAALLLLLGYSVDTDVLLTTRILKSRGDLKDKIQKSMKTGLTMTVTTLAALTVLYFVAGNQIITQIASILIIGLLFDAINTWIMNINLLRMYVEKHPEKVR